MMKLGMGQNLTPAPWPTRSTAVLGTHLAILVLLGQPAFLEIQ